MPYYNVERYLRECLTSIVQQHVQDFEVILVDDGSADGSRAIAEEFAAADPRFSIITQENQGLGLARNTGTRAATGRYLTFVDSDDLIPRRGWQRMLGSLERSGSDFALGDARRFDQYAVRRSWLHEQFATEARTGTTVAETPVLANDRMAWNKIFRRSFWDAHDLAFPPRLYEDYPPALRAHLLATGVDVIPEPVYMWRERGGGEHSITQRALEPDNVQDRFDSASVVLDLADQAPPAVTREVQHHLLGPDVGTILRAVALPANEAEVPRLLELANRLLDRMDPEVLARRRPLERLAFGLLRYGGLEQIRAWQRIRVQTPPPAGHRTEGLLRRRRLLVFPGTDLEPVARTARLVSSREIDLDGRVLGVRWEDGTLCLDVRTWMHFGPPGPRPRLTAWLDRPGSRRVPFEVAEVTSDQATVSASLRVAGDAILAASGPGEGDWVVRVRLTGDGVTREGHLPRISAGAATFGASWVSDHAGAGGTWLVAGHDFADHYVVRVLRPAAVLDTVSSLLEGEIALGGTSVAPLPMDGTLLRVDGPDREVRFPVIVDAADPRRWQARVQVAAVTTPVQQADELLDARGDQRLSLLTPGAEYPLLARPGMPAGRFGHRHREVQVVGGRFLGARLDEMRPHFVLETATPDEHRMRLTGCWLDTRADVDRVVLRWHYLSERPEEIAIPVVLDGERFEFEVDLDELGNRVAEVLAAHPIEDFDAPPVTGHDWMVCFERAGREESVQLTISLARALPDPWPTKGGLVSLSTHEHLGARFLVQEV